MSTTTTLPNIVRHLSVLLVLMMILAISNSETTTTTQPMTRTTPWTTTTIPWTTTTPPWTTTTPPWTTTASPTTSTTFPPQTTETTTLPRPTTGTTSVETTTTVATPAMRVDVLSYCSLTPTRGPVAGGTNICFSGIRQDEIIDAIYFGSAITRDIITITYGIYHRFTDVDVYSPEAKENGSVAIDVVVNGIQMTTNLSFDYRPNPNIDRFVFAPVQLTSGGSLLTVLGSSLDSVVSAKVNVTVVIVQAEPCNRCRRATNITQPYTAVKSNIGYCTSESSENMTCLLPDLNLPENFTSDLQEKRQNEGNFSTTEPGSVAKLFGPDDSVAYVYIGFIFDGYGKYENVSDPKSGLQDPLHLSFIPPPVIKSSTDLIIFDPKKEDEIQIKGDRLLDGCSFGVLCEVLVGDSQCRIAKVSDNVITCAPKKERPHQTRVDSLCNQTHPNSFTVKINIGFRSYYYECLDYYSLNIGLIVGLTVGLGIPLLIVIIVALFLCIRKLRSSKTPPPSSARQLPRPEETDPVDSSFRGTRPQSNMASFSQNPKRNTIFQNLRMSVQRSRNANGSNIKNNNQPESQYGGDFETDDVESQIDDVTARPKNDDRKTFYPPEYLKSTDYNEYQSNINDDRVESGSYDNRIGQSEGDGGLQGHSRQSYFPPSFGDKWEKNYDNDVAQNEDESDDQETYTNFGEFRS